VEAGAVYHDSIESLLKVTEILSLHCPSSDETKKLMNAQRLDLLPPGAVIINTARGDIVDDEALLARLKDGRIFAAGLDVFQGEPNVHAAYRTLPNVFVLPHLGSATVETRDGMGFRALDNIDAVLSGQTAPDALRPHNLMTAVHQVEGN
jgi:lactate dehydrogenase-like 2-hydroxyacid dehydrogenase